MKQSITKMEIHLLRRAAGSGEICPRTVEEREVVAELLRRALLRRRFWHRRGAARLTKAGWAVIDSVDDDPWAD